MASGIDYNLSNRESVACVSGKLFRKPFTGSGRERETRLLELIYAVCGPMPETSWSGARYVFILVDDFSAITFSYFMKHKPEAAAAFKQLKAWVGREHDKKIKIIRTDNGKEFVNIELDNFLKSERIKH